MILAAGIVDPTTLIESAGNWALLLVAATVFVETGLLIGFMLPGDTLLLVTGILTNTGTIPQPIWLARSDLSTVSRMPSVMRTQY